MKDKINSAKNRVTRVILHVHRCRGRYGFATGVVAAYTLYNKIDRVSDWHAFLEEKGLTDEFYHSED